MSTNFEYYKIFYYVAKYKNFTHAAQVLYINQPSVTRYIHLLEEELGCRLFIRSKQGVKLTPEGDLLYEHVAPACESLFSGEEKLHAVKDLKEGTLLIGTTEIAFRTVLLNKLHIFRQRYPDIKVKISCDTAPQSVSNLLSGKYELNLITTPIDIKDTIAMHKVMSLQDVLICKTGYINLAENTPYTLKDVCSYPMVTLPDSTSTRRFYESFYYEAGLQFKVDIEVSSIDLILPVIQRGLAIGFIPQKIVEPYLHSGEISVIPLAEKMPTRSICILWDKQRPLSLAAHKFFEVLTKDYMP
ncbi:LysR family transcriptional regulator [Megasphaera sueciensis]|uniref:LysR family transcriptional regulator n=1 Tax=Megasphaera sueciensis TaxID=349094 RepID=UPI003CFCFC0C